MKQWMTRELVAPRWIILAIAVLSIVSFFTIYAKAHELDDELHSTKIELRKAKDPSILCIWTMDIPPVGTLRFPEMQVGFLCNLGIVIGAACVLLQSWRSATGTKDPNSFAPKNSQGE